MGKKGRKMNKSKGGSKAAAETGAGKSAAKAAQELREAAEPMIRLATSPVVSDLIASAMVAGAGALTRSPTGQQAALGIEEGASELVDNTEQAARKGVDLASLVAYSVAVAAGHVAQRLVDRYEQQFGGSGAADQVAEAARQAADSAWAAFGKDQG